MARLGGLSSETFSLSPPTGLGSILRDQKILPGARNSRSNVILGIVRPSHSVSLSSSPKESLLLDIGAADDPDDLKDEDIWHMDDALEGVAHASGVKMPRFGQTEDFGLEAAPLRKNRYSKEIGCGIGTPKTDDAQKVVLTMRRGRTSNNGPMGPSLLSRPLESSPLSNGHNIPRLSSASRMIPMSEGSRNNSSSGHAGGQSAPVEVPKWSKMMGRESKIGIMDDQDAKDDDNDRLPPHELLARENASRQHTTFSVCEGLGRTLKGRDLSRVRNAVWSQMGFAD